MSKPFKSTKIGNCSRFACTSPVPEAPPTPAGMILPK